MVAMRIHQNEINVQSKHLAWRKLAKILFHPLLYSAFSVNDSVLTNRYDLENRQQFPSGVN